MGHIYVTNPWSSATIETEMHKQNEARPTYISYCAEKPELWLDPKKHSTAQITS